MVVIMVLLLSSAVMAETTVNYPVKRGDSLWRIGKNFQVRWQRIAQTNKIKGPKYVIYPKQVLVIPEKHWEVVGGNPYEGTYQWAITNFNLPSEIKRRVMKNIRNSDFQWLKGGLKSSQRLEQVTFGQDQIWDDVLTVWSNGLTYAARDYGVDEYHVIFVLECKNWVWWREEKEEVKKKEVSFPPVPIFVGEKEEALFPPVPVFERQREEASFPPVPVFVGQKEKIEEIDPCRADLYIGGGIYETDRWLNSNNKDYYANGWYLWAKGRYRPLGFRVNKNITACFGGFAFGALGQGDDQNYNYSWRKWLIGPSLKLMGPHWDADFDFGWGKLISEGGESLYQSNQWDDIYSLAAHLNLYQRKDRGEKWFPKTEGNIELTLPYRDKHEHSWNGNAIDPNPYDNKVLEIALTQHVYDFKLSDHWLLTPGVNLAYIKEFGRDDPNFLQFGPRMTMGWYGKDILSVSFLNYKENLGGNGDQWHWLSGYLSIGGLIEAYNSSQITEAEAKDLVCCN